MGLDGPEDPAEFSSHFPLVRPFEFMKGQMLVSVFSTLDGVAAEPAVRFQGLVGLLKNSLLFGLSKVFNGPANGHDVELSGRRFIRQNIRFDKGDARVEVQPPGL